MTLFSVFTTGSSSGREGLVNMIRDLHQPLFLTGLIQLFTNETDLMAADRETLAISDLTKEDFHPRDLERIKSWWEIHQSEYTNWPYSELNQGLVKLLVMQTSEAAKSFEEVLKLDPAADMSRAFAITCYWETGETNKALTLAKEFKDTSGRWVRLASAKAELETGNVTNATLQLANLYTNYPTMLAKRFIQEGFPVWRKVNWELFKQSTGQTK